MYVKSYDIDVSSSSSLFRLFNALNVYALCFMLNKTRDEKIKTQQNIKKIA